MFDLSSCLNRLSRADEPAQKGNGWRDKHEPLLLEHARNHPGGQWILYPTSNGN